MGGGEKEFLKNKKKSPKSHPNGENILLFLEKDWHWNNKTYSVDHLLRLIRSAKEVLQVSCLFVFVVVFVFFKKISASAE
jgi:hypothetical protein